MRELTNEEVGTLSGGNPAVLLGLGLGGLIGGGLSAADYALGSGQFTYAGLTLSFAQGFVTGVLTTGGTALLGVPGGAAAGIPAIGLAGIIEATDPIKSLE